MAAVRREYHHPQGMNPLGKLVIGILGQEGCASARILPNSLLARIATGISFLLQAGPRKTPRINNSRVSIRVQERSSFTNSMRFADCREMV